MIRVLLPSVIAGLATCFGALLILSLKKFSVKSLALLLGLSAGIMSGVVLFDLLPSAWMFGNPITAVTGFGTGLAVLLLLDRLITWFTPAPSERRAQQELLNMGYLIATGIALHDFPEGMAIAVGFAATTKLAGLIALAIGLHNIPEGMATAAPLRMGGLRRWRIFYLNLLISLFTPLGTLLGLILVSISRNFIGILLALAAGAMAYIVCNELVPTACRYHLAMAATGVAGGLLCAFFLSLL
jgi:ZIP family zinc transporter